MSSSHYQHGDTWDIEEWPVHIIPESDAYVRMPPIEFVVIFMALFIVVALGWGALGLYSHTGDPTTSRPPESAVDQSKTTNGQPLAPLPPSTVTVIAPYDQYILTQGLHGMSYGHMAIDIAAGKGTPIKSPINGRVSEYFIDDIGNPTIIIENDHYKVTLLHGIYTAKSGDILNIGDEIGTESNQGNTRDMQGRSCRGRDCGYHTHLNIFDKIAQSNIDPLTVIGN